ncbi:hypothetical protein EVAR_57405_1 [Eumeta japonica]|uniref:Uncharacterized protein n=1 Tax=Eumeta variegata TaxID=151549 RepID=A0A4C1YEP2_EUMVA|nr:hypothetical protein EVAR_57405_1 [Eumeta japonica]
MVGSGIFFMLSSMYGVSIGRGVALCPNAAVDEEGTIRPLTSYTSMLSIKHLHVTRIECDVVEANRALLKVPDRKGAHATDSMARWDSADFAISDPESILLELPPSTVNVAAMMRLSINYRSVSACVFANVANMDEIWLSLIMSSGCAVDLSAISQPTSSDCRCQWWPVVTSVG